MANNKSKTTKSGASSRSGNSSRSGKSTSTGRNTAGAKRSGNGRKTASGSAKGSGAGKRSSTVRSTTANREHRYQSNPIRRLVGATVCLLLSVFGFLTFFQVDALFINFFRRMLKGLFGYGFWFVPPALLLAGIVLLIHQFCANRGPVGRRVVCSLLLPLLFGGMIHTIHVSGQYSLTEWKLLWESGLTLASGGAAAGWFAVLLCKLFSKIGAIVVYVLILLFCFMMITRITPLDIVDAIRRYAAERPAYPDDEPYEESEAEAIDDERLQVQRGVERKRPVGRKGKQTAIDIPLESEPIAAPSGKQRKKAEGSLFEKKSAVRPPHELLAEEMDGGETASDSAEAPSDQELLAELDLKFPDLDQIPVKKTEPASPAPAPEQGLKPDDDLKDTSDIFGTVGLQPGHEESKAEKQNTEHTAAAVSPQPAAAPAARTTVTTPTAVPSAPVSAPASVAVPTVAKTEHPTETPISEQMKKSETAIAAAKARMGIDAEDYQYPPTDLLEQPGIVSNAAAADEIQNTRDLLDDTIQSFGIDARIINVTRGPSVTRYELELMRGVKLNKLTNLAGDIALSLGAASVRIAPITGRNSVVGVEVPNQLVTPVPIREVIDSREFRTHVSKVAFAVGKDISGKNVVGNIAKLPHMLIAGTTGSGKSVCTNSLIISLLYKASPEDVRMIMVDPKMVELGIYNGIPHLLIPVVTDPKKAAGALQWAVTEMMKRYRLFSEIGVRDLASYNAHVLQQEGGKKLPQIVVVIDELADLMLVAAKEVEESICRVAQMGRAAGMHLIIATQRPSSDVITGLMKANIPSRIAFAVASSLESRIILDNTGAEKLVGKGDMLYAPLGIGKPMRVQGCMISDEEVAKVVAFIKQNSTENYDNSVMKEVESNAENTGKGGKGTSGSGSNTGTDSSAAEVDEILSDAVEMVIETGMASVSMLQRRLKLGYSRAARVIDQMEERGIVGPFEGSKPRQVLITREQWNQMKPDGNSDAAAIPAAEFAAALAMNEASDLDAQAMPDYEDDGGDAPF